VERSETANANRRSRTLIAAGIAIAVAVLAGWIASRRISPYLRDRVKRELAERFQADVEIRSLSVSLFPHAGVTGEGIKLRERGSSTNAPLIEIRKFTAGAGLFGLLATPSRIHWVRLEGLQIHVPPHRDRGGQDNKPKRQPRPFVLEEVIADGTELEIAPRTAGKDPKVFQIARLALHSAGTDGPMNFVASVANPTPPGTIESSGQFGPWQVEEPGQTPVSGKYTFRDADLSVFTGISGKLTSEGAYKGVLARIDVDGKTDTPDFALKHAGNRVHLTTEFHAVVNGTSGDTELDPVNAHFLHTTVVARGAVSGTHGIPGKTVSLDVSVEAGRLEDLLRLAVGGAEAPMSGGIGFQAKLTIPPGKNPVIDKLDLAGSFGILGAQFSRLGVQEKIASLSHRAQGQPMETGDRVVSQLHGRFEVKDGNARFSKITFAVPGALIALTGSYGIGHDDLDFRGTATTDATISQMTTGIKSFLLKAVDPFFRKNGAGAVIPIRITGTRSNPQFGLAIGGPRRK
jgi:hypothetical protein